MVKPFSPYSDDFIFIKYYLIKLGEINLELFRTTGTIPKLFGTVKRDFRQKKKVANYCL